MKPLRCLVALILTALAPAVFAAEFEGIVQMKMTDSRSTHTLQYQVKEGFVRTDIQISPGKASSVIMDFKNKRMIILMPGQNMYMTRPFPESLSAPASRPASTPCASWLRRRRCRSSSRRRLRSPPRSKLSNLFA